jgi:hypothetical protein
MGEGQQRERWFGRSPPQLPIERPAVFRSSRPRVEDEVVEWVPAVGHHFDVHVLREDEDGCAGVAAADADVVQPTVVPQDERAVRVDLVVADTEVGLPTAGPKKNDVAGHLRMVSCDIAVERVTGIEPAWPAWKALTPVSRPLPPRGIVRQDEQEAPRPQALAGMDRHRGGVESSSAASSPSRGRSVTAT